MNSRRRLRLRLALVLSMIALAMLVSCGEDDELPYAPLDCERSRPATGFLDVRVTLNADNLSVRVTIYSGDFEDDVVVAEETVDVETFSFELPADADYSATALYFDGPDSCLTLDGSRIGTELVEYRDRGCWELNNGSVNLRFSGSCSGGKLDGR